MKKIYQFLIFWGVLLAIALITWLTYYLLKSKPVLCSCVGKSCSQNSDCGDDCCVCYNGKCCQPNCENKTCSQDNGCGQPCGCSPPNKCVNGKCCAEQCDGIVCGKGTMCDGGSCECDSTQVCYNGICCTPKICQGTDFCGDPGCGLPSCNCNTRVGQCVGNTCQYNNICNLSNPTDKANMALWAKFCDSCNSCNFTQATFNGDAIIPSFGTINCDRCQIPGTTKWNSNINEVSIDPTILWYSVDSTGQIAAGPKQTSKGCNNLGCSDCFCQTNADCQRWGCTTCLSGVCS